MSWRALPMLAMFAAGCGRDAGTVLDLTATLTCAPLKARVSSVHLEVMTTPPATRGGENTFDINVASLDQFRAVLLLPEETTHAKVHAEARAGTTTVLASGDLDLDVAIGVHARIIDLIANCNDMAVQDMSVEDMTDVPDLTALAPDFTTIPADLLGVAADGLPIIASVEVRGARPGANDMGVPPLEGEGSTAPTANSGVAMLIRGSRLRSTTPVTSSYTKAIIGSTVLASADGTQLAAAVTLQPDPAFTAAGNIQDIPLAVGFVPTSFKMRGLDELTGNPTLMNPGLAPILYSRASGNVTINGLERGYLWVTGDVNVGTVAVTPGTCRGFSAANGPGAGGSGSGGGGGGFGTNGTAGGGGGGGSAGGTYGEASLFGLLQGGSGGGNGSVGGGAGGGTLRLRAGKIVGGSFNANGLDGTNGGVLQSGGGGGSGGALLITAQDGIAGTTSAGGGAGGTSPLGLGGAGGGGGAGRIRIDVGTAQAVGGTPASDYSGGVIASGWPTAWQGAPTSVDVSCARSVVVQIEIDGVVSSAPLSCGSGAATTIINLPITVAPSLGSLHTVCVRSLTGTAANKVWTGEDSEDLHCRAIAVIKP